MGDELGCTTDIDRPIVVPSGLLSTALLILIQNDDFWSRFPPSTSTAVLYQVRRYT